MLSHLAYPIQPLLPFGDTRFVPGLEQSVPFAGDSLHTTDAYSAMQARGFRISKEFIETQMRDIHFLNLGAAMEMAGLHGTASEHRTTVCSVTMKNGFCVIGKSTPIDPVNFDIEKGKRFAYEDAFRQLWPLLAFAWLAATEAERDEDGNAPDTTTDEYRGADGSNEHEGASTIMADAASEGPFPHPMDPDIVDPEDPLAPPAGEPEGGD